VNERELTDLLKAKAACPGASKGSHPRVPGCVLAAMDIDLSLDALAAAFVVAKRDTMPALKQAGDQHGPTVLVATFVMLAETLAGFGADEAAGPARPPARATKLS
jgi:hypothetical protein